MEGRAKRTKSSFRELLWGLCGGTDLNKAQRDKGTNGRAASRALRVGRCLCLLAPQRHLGAQHAPSKWWPRRGPLTQSLYPFLLFPHPRPPLPSLPPHVLSHAPLFLLLPLSPLPGAAFFTAGQNDWFEGRQVMIIPQHRLPLLHR